MADCKSTRPFAAHLLAMLNAPPPEIDPALQSAQCYERAREFLGTARLAREIGTRKQVSMFVRAAQMMRFAANRWRERAQAAATLRDNH